MPEYEVQEVLDGLHSPYENLVYDILGYSGVIKERNVLVLTIPEEEKIQKAMESMLSDRQQGILNCLYGITGEKKTQKDKILFVNQKAIETFLDCFLVSFFFSGFSFQSLLFRAESPNLPLIFRGFTDSSVLLYPGQHR